MYDQYHRDRGMEATEATIMSGSNTWEGGPCAIPAWLLIEQRLGAGIFHRIANDLRWWSDGRSATSQGDLRMSASG